MRNLKQIFDSIVKSYNKNETINFFDLNHLGLVIENTELMDSITKSYNKKESINFIDIRGIEKCIEEEEGFSKAVKAEKRKVLIEKKVMAEGLKKDDRQTILFNETGSFFAFSNKQLDEKKKEGVVYTNLGAGLICPKGKASFVFEMLEKIEKEEISNRVKNGSLEGIIEQAFYNYETNYTCDETDARDSLAGYIEHFPKLFTEKLITAVFKKCYRTSF
jgi:hypothetical protein